MPFLVMPIAAVVAGLCLVLAARGLLLMRSIPTVPAYLAEPPREVGAELPKERIGPLTAMLRRVGRPFVGTTRNLLGEARLVRLRRRMRSAGLSGVLPMDEFLARRTGALVLFGLLGLIMMLVGHVVVGIVIALYGLLWYDLWLFLRSRRRRDEIERTLPDFLDVLAVTVTAGLGFRLALQRVCESMPGALAEEFTVSLRQMDLGSSRRETFHELREYSASPSLAQFITAILQAEELGAPLANALMEISNDMRRGASQAARRRAARTAPRIQLVVTFVMVPATLLLIATIFLLGSSAAGVSGVFG